MLTHWKDREPVYRTRERRIIKELGYLPAYAVPMGSAPVDVAPVEPRGGRRSVTAPQDPTNVSREDFDAMVRDLGIEEDRQPAEHRRDRGRPAGGRRARANGGDGPRPGPRWQHAREARRRGRRRGLQAQEAPQPQARAAALMAMLVWSMMGIALWHFTIFIPDRFWGGIVGAFLGALFGAVLIGLAVNGFTVPGQDDTSLVSALEAIPGAIAGIAAVYFLGVRQGNEAHASRRSRVARTTRARRGTARARRAPP